MGVISEKGLDTTEGVRILIIKQDRTYLKSWLRKWLSLSIK